MKWEKYNQLSNEDKEEYNFRFEKDVYIFGSSALVFGLLFIMLVVILLLTSSLMYMNKDLFSEIAFLELNIITQRIFMLSDLFVIIFIAGLVIDIVLTFHNNYRENKWLKERCVI